MIEQSAGLSYEHRLAPRWILGIWHKIQAFVAAAKETEPVTIARIHNSTPVSNQNCVLLTQYACVSTSCPSLNDSRSTRGCVKAVESCAPAVRIYVSIYCLLFRGVFQLFCSVNARRGATARLHINLSAGESQY